MRLQRVGRDAGIVAPHLLQQRLARHRLLPGAVEIAQDRGFLLGQPDLAALGAQQQLGARPERVGADGEDGVFARLVLAKLRADARQQHGEAERLGDVVVGAGFQAEDGVGIGVVPGQHDDRRLEAVLAQDAHGLAAVDIRQADIHDHQVDLAALGRLHTLGAAIDRDRLELVMQRKLLDQRGRAARHRRPRSGCCGYLALLFTRVPSSQPGGLAQPTALGDSIRA